MIRKLSIIVTLAALAGAGAWYVIRHEVFVIDTVPSPPGSQAVPEQPRALPDEELKRRRQEGIGSIKDLKPVPIPPSADRNR